MTLKYTFAVICSLVLIGCKKEVSKSEKELLAEGPSVTVNTAVGPITLPPPFATESVAVESKQSEWPEGTTPSAPEGFKVTLFAKDLQNPRWAYVGPNNDVFIVESEANRISVFRDKDNDGELETRSDFATDLNKPFGMLIIGSYFYIANTDGLYRYPYKTGQLKLEAGGQKILELPAGGYNNHWTRNIIANADNTKIYVSVGSGSNVGENGMEEEARRANILEINPDGTGERIFASGLRNPVGMDWNPTNKELWTAVNERDELGDDLVPDYITSVKEGGFYGWPYSYFGSIPDPRMKGEGAELAAKSIVPDVSVGSHTASLGLAFYTKNAFPEKYRNGAFVGQHGSWNRSKIAGYKVVFVPFKNGKPSGKPEDFLTGFIANNDKAEVYGRPVCVAMMPDGSMLVTDDGSNLVWRVSATK